MCTLSTKNGCQFIGIHVRNQPVSHVTSQKQPNVSAIYNGFNGFNFLKAKRCVTSQNQPNVSAIYNGFNGFNFLEAKRFGCYQLSQTFSCFWN